MTETLAYGYSSESTQRELSNEYQYDRVWMVFKNLCILVLWMKVALAIEGLKNRYDSLIITEILDILFGCSCIVNRYFCFLNILNVMLFYI